MPIRLFPRPGFTDAQTGRGGAPAPVWSRAVLLSALTLLPSIAVWAQHANSACSALKSDIEQAANPLERMQAALPTCANDAVFLTGLGALLNRQLRYSEAQDHLERALMLEPGLLNAQLNYAIALAGSGDLASAEAMLDRMLDNPDMPVSLRRAIAQQKAALNNTYAPTEWQSRLSLGLRVGYDSNLLGSPNLAAVTLTYPTQNLVLQLDESYLSKGGGYLRADAQWDVRKQDPDGTRWDLLASLRSRYSPVDSAAGSTQADLAVERSRYEIVSAPQGRPASAQGTYFGLSVSELTAHAGTHYNAVGLAGGWGRNWSGNILNNVSAETPGKALANCQARLGGEFQDRSYLNNQLLSGRYSGLSASMACNETGGWQWLAGLKAGRDLAKDGTRPGGDQSQINLRLAASVAVADLFSGPGNWVSPLHRGSFLADVDFGNYHDSKAYSEIIDSGRSRIINRAAARLEYQHPVAKSFQWVTGAEWVSQRSTVELFRQQSWGGYMAVRTTW
jgi:tetratricopeptide (TPR) repeat protein